MLEFEDDRSLDNIDAVILVHYSGDERDDAGFLLATSHDAYGTVGLRNLDLESTQWLRDGPPIVEVRKSDNTGARRVPLIKTNMRSEEHTSELQSLMRISYAVFCLKKNTNNN